MLHPLQEFLLSPEALDRLNDPEFLKQAQNEGMTGQKVLQFSNEAMAKFYGAARQIFDSDLFADAADAFLFLVTLNPHNFEYWVGLGMATQMEGSFEKAIDAYEMAAICELENPIPYFYLAKCLFAIHDRQAAAQALELAIEYAGQNPEFAELKKQALAAQELII